MLSISILQVVDSEKRNPIVARSLVSAGEVRHRCGCVLDASVTRGMLAFGAGCASGWNALSRAGVHSSAFLPPLREVVSGSRAAAIPGLKWR